MYRVREWILAYIKKLLGVRSPTGHDLDYMRQRMMGTYKFDCAKCSNKYINSKGEEWCRPAIENGKVPSHIKSGDSGRNFVFECKEYTNDETKRMLKLQEEE